MLSKFLDSSEIYDGAQLVSLRNYLQHKLLGDSVIAWIGPCHVTMEHMVDGEDLVAGAQIKGDLMLHFIAEIFESSLFGAVGCQRLLAALIMDHIRETSSKTELTAKLRRDGDDVYCGDLKLSISIATQSPVSSLIHFAVNVLNQGTPVPTISLQEFGLDPRAFAEEILRRFTGEVDSVRIATQKVRWVR
ncbi:MAG: DUF366 family protein [Bdellovibrionales bacterium]